MAEHRLDHSPQGMRLARLSQGRVVAFDFELKDQSSRYHHGVYVGTVVDILKGGQMAFVEIGLKKPGVLQLKERHLATLTRGENVVVQVTREADPQDGKGVHLSRHISLALGPMLYTPLILGFSASKKMRDSQLANEFGEILKENEGVVLRHWADRFDVNTLKNILENLREKWKAIQQKSEAKPPHCLMAPPSLLDRLVIQLEPGDSILCNHKPTIQALSQLLIDAYGGGPAVEFTRESPFDDNIEDQWESLTEKVIGVPGGGQLIIEETAALVSIDVNSGGAHLTGHDLNRRALKEIFHQIGLRNLAGIIVIDLAGNIKHPKQLIQSARGLAASDTHVHGITDLGLLEISRRKSGPTLTQLLTNTGKETP